jgi:hypothetical protein
LPPLKDPQPENCRQIGYSGDGCWLETDAYCSNGLRRVTRYDPREGEGWIIIRSEARDCETRYPVEFRQ